MRMKNTFDDYKEAIKSEYEIAKNGDYASFLFQPTPALLRDFCLILADGNLNDNDRKVMKLFFGVGESNDLRNVIDNCDIDKFRPIISIFREDKKVQHELRMNMAAILVGFNPRPFSKFREKGTTPVKKNDEEGESIIGKPLIKPLPSAKKWKAAAAVILILSFGFVLKTVLFPSKCMVWKGDHYELVVPEHTANPSIKYEPVDPNKLKYMRKIAVCDTTTFFKDGKPVIWYSQNGGYEYFTYHGLHPVTGKTLKQITRTIIIGHVKPCK